MKTKVADIASLEEGKALCVKAKDVSLVLVKKDAPFGPSLLVTVDVIDDWPMLKIRLFRCAVRI